MKASEMTNEMLAKELMSRVPLDSNSHDDLREAAARLREYDAAVLMYSDEMSLVSALRAKLKVAEDALEKIKQYGADGEQDHFIAVNALAAIR